MKIRITGLPSKKKAPSLYGFGGNLGTNGADFTDGLTYFNVPTRHETNPNGGIPLGVAPDGLPNLVEGKEENKKGDGGEIKWNSLDYIFSDRLTPSEDLIAKWRLAKSFLKYTYADVVRKSPVVKEAEQRPNDPKSLDTLDKFLADVAEDQELTKKLKEAALMLEQLSQMSDDELMALGAQMSLLLQEAARQQEMELLTLLPDDYESLAQNASLENIQSAALMNQMAQQQGMVQPLMVGAEGGTLFAEGGQPEVMEQMPLDIPQEQQPMSMEPQQEMMLQLPMLEPIPLEMPQEERKPAEEMSTRELNEALDEIIEYAKETKDRLLLREAKKVKRSGTREEKEAFVDDTFEEIEMAEEEAAAQEQQAALEATLEPLEVPQEQPVMMAEGGEMPTEEPQPDTSMELPLQSLDGERLIQQLLQIGDQLGYGKDSEYTPLEVEDLLTKASLSGIDVSSLQSQSSELLAEMLTLLLQLVNNQLEVLLPVAPEAPLENLFKHGGGLDDGIKIELPDNVNDTVPYTIEAVLLEAPKKNTASYDGISRLRHKLNGGAAEHVVTVNEGDTRELQQLLMLERDSDGIHIPETVVIGHYPRPRVLLSPLLFMALFPTDDEDIFANTRALIESTGKKPSEITSQELAQRAIALEENKRAERKKYYLQQLLGYDYPLYSYMADGGPIFAQGGSMSLDNNEGNHVFAGVPLDWFGRIEPQTKSFWESLSPEVQAFLAEYGFTRNSKAEDVVERYNTDEAFKNEVTRRGKDEKSDKDFIELLDNLLLGNSRYNMIDSYNGVTGGKAFWNRLTQNQLSILRKHGFDGENLDLGALYDAVHKNGGLNALNEELKKDDYLELLAGNTYRSRGRQTYSDLFYLHSKENFLREYAAYDPLQPLDKELQPAEKEEPSSDDKQSLDISLWSHLNPKLLKVLQKYGLSSSSTNDQIITALRTNEKLRTKFAKLYDKRGVYVDNRIAAHVLLSNLNGQEAVEAYKSYFTQPSEKSATAPVAQGNTSASKGSQNTTPEIDEDHVDVPALFRELSEEAKLKLQQHGISDTTSLGQIRSILKDNEELRKFFVDERGSTNDWNIYAILKYPALPGDDNAGADSDQSSWSKKHSNASADIEDTEEEEDEEEYDDGPKNIEEKVTPKMRRWAKRNGVSYNSDDDLITRWNEHVSATRRWGKTYENLSKEDLEIARRYIGIDVQAKDLKASISRNKTEAFLDNNAPGWSEATDLTKVPKDLFEIGVMPSDWDYKTNGQYEEGKWDFSELFGNNGEPIMKADSAVPETINSNNDDTIGVIYTGYTDYEKKHPKKYQYDGREVDIDELRNATRESKEAFVEAIRDELEKGNFGVALNMLFRMGAGANKGAENLYYEVDEEGKPIKIKDGWDKTYMYQANNGPAALNHGYFKKGPGRNVVYRIKGNDGLWLEVFGKNPTLYKNYYEVNKDEKDSNNKTIYYNLSPINTNRNLVTIDGVTYRLPDNPDNKIFAKNDRVDVTPIGPGGATNTDLYYDVILKPATGTEETGNIKSPYPYTNLLKFLPFLNFPYLEGYSSYNEMANAANGLKYIGAPDHREYLKYTPSDLLYRVNQALMAGTAANRGIAGLSNRNQGTLLANLALLNAKNRELLGEIGLKSEEENWNRQKDVVAQHNQVDSAYDLLALEADKANLSNNPLLVDARQKAATLKYAIEKGNNDSKAAWQADMLGLANSLAKNEEQWYWYDRFLNSGVNEVGADIFGRGSKRGVATPPYRSTAKGGCLTIRRKRRNRLS